MTTTELCAYLQISRETLYGWRYRGLGPRAIKVGKHLRFDEDEVRGWLLGRSDHEDRTH